MMSSRSCAICGPKRISRALCNCCQEYLCLDHLKEHDHLLNAQIEPLVDHINQLLDSLTNFNTENVLQPIYFQLDQWKQTAIQSIENIHQEKLNQINDFVTKEIDDLRQQTEQIQKNLSQIIDQQDPTNEQIEFLFTTIQSIQKQTSHLENKPIQLDIQPLVINQNYIHFYKDEEPQQKEKQTNHNNQLILSEILQTITSSPNNSDCIASNDQYILLHHHPSLCLYDHNLNLIKQTYPYSDLSVTDMSWSITLNKFLILTNENLFTLNETNMILEKSASIPTPNKGHWHNLTSSLTNLYLTAYKWGTSIYQYNLNEFGFEFNRRWQTPLTCSKDESIDHLIHNNKSELVMIIQNRINNQKYFQLKNDQTLVCIWSYQFDQYDMNIQRNRFCLIDYDQYLIINSNQSQLIILSENGLFKQIIEYHFNQPLRALLIKHNFIVITTKDSINLHQLIT